MMCAIGPFEIPEFTGWARWALYGLSAASLFIGILSVASPRKSIGLYQTIMRWLNWRVEPIDRDHEMRMTKGFGVILVILAALILAIL